MSILNLASDGTLSLLVVLWRAVAVFGPTKKSRLVDLCAPSTVATDDRDKRLAVTLTRWTQLGAFIQREDETVQLSKTIKGIPPEDVDLFRDRLLPLVLAGGEVGDDRASDEHSGAAARDFNLAAAWLLMQDPYGFSNDWEEVQKAENAQGNYKFFSNQTRWTGFKAWAPFLGVSLRGSKSGMVLNPARSVRCALRESVKSLEKSQHEGVPVGIFLDALAERLPIVDGGARWREVLELIPRPWRRFGANEISPCLSLALLQLRHEEVIRLDARSDAQVQKVLLGRNGRELERVSHVVLGGHNG